MTRGKYYDFEKGRFSSNYTAMEKHRNVER